MLHALFLSFPGTVQLTLKRFHYIELGRMAFIEGFIFPIPMGQEQASKSKLQRSFLITVIP